ncbi:hypothetical protein [Streptomyces sp. NPDC006739]|uniref:hypothetical protein n=1 Tax=Streptomyces sp. NPDC006739 TaxID=3364763 RepID=UPI0036877928
MTLSAVQSGAAVRVMRTVAGRRALQVALLVGGLFLLGFVCGEQAHAAEGTPAVTSVTSSAHLAGDVVGDVTRPAPARRVADPLKPSGPVESVEPVGSVVTTAVHGLVEEWVKPTSLPLLPKLPGAPTIPSVPAVPPVPAVAELPAVPSLPGAAPLPGRLLPVPVTAAPAPPRPEAPRRTATPRSAGSGAEAVPVSTPTAYGPGIGVAVPAPDASAHGGGQRVARPAAPTRPAPPVDRDGAVGKAAVDGAASRHGDAHAVTLDHLAPLRLAPGVPARGYATGLRDGHRDIPVFPG